MRDQIIKRNYRQSKFEYGSNFKYDKNNKIFNQIRKKFFFFRQ